MTFAAPLFLWGLVALAIPIAVHLFQLRRYRKVYFSNVDRLQALQSASRRQSELRRWLVLLMRCLAIVFIVLAFAQPTLPGSGQQLRSGDTVVSVYIDNSFSMENSTSDGSQLEAAKQKAREIAAAYRPGDRYQLLSNAMSGDENRWLSREEFLHAIDLLSINPASHRLSEVAASQSNFMRLSGAANRHAYIVSDFQRSAADLDALPADSMAHFTLVPLQGVATDNIYIDTLRLDAPAYFVGGSVSVEASVRNCGASDVEKLPVRLTVNGRQRAIATIDIPAGSTAKASLRFSIDSAGWHDGSVNITDYPITFDDRYYFSLLAGSQINMLQVDGATPNTNLRRLFGADSAIAYQAAPLPSDLSQLDFIVLNEPDNLSSGQAQAVASWVENGGTLAVIPSANTKNDALNTLLTLLQAPTLERWQKHPVKATSVDFQNNLYRDVFNGTSSDMEMPSVQGHYTLGNNSVRQDIITLADGTPLLCTSPHGDGRLYLFSSPLTDEWTSFVSQALFVPTLYNMALYSRPQPQVAHTLGDRAPVALHGNYDPAGIPPQLSLPSPQPVTILPDIRRLGNRCVLMLHGELTADGIYLLDQDEHLAFNHPRIESQLDFLSPSDIKDLLDGRPHYSLVRNAAKPLQQEIRSSHSGTPLWQACLLLALAALLIETLLLKVSRRTRKK